MKPTRKFSGTVWLLSPDQPHTQSLQHARCKLPSFMLVKSDCEYGHFLQNLSLQSRYYVSVMADDESLGQSVVVVLVQTMPAKSNVHSLNNIELRRIRPERTVDSQCCFHWAFLSVLTFAMYLFCKRQVLQCRPVQVCDT